MLLLLLLSMILSLGACSKNRANAPVKASPLKSEAGIATADSEEAPVLRRAAEPDEYLPATGIAGTPSVPLEPVEGSVAFRETESVKPVGSLQLGPLATLVPLNPGSFEAPSDPEIGPLLSSLTSGADATAVRTVVEPFLVSLSKGKIIENSIIEKERLDILRSLTYTLNSGIDVSEFRLGAFHSTDEHRGYLKVRLMNGAASSSGELYLEEEDSIWYVSDVQIDLSPLSAQ